MNINAIITARYYSQRLPGKALLDINSKPILQRIVDTLRQSKYIQDVIVATSTTSPQILKYCETHDIKCFGLSNEEDCLTRLYNCVKSYPSEKVVRVWGDCPFLNINLIDNSIEQTKGYDMCYPIKYPKGWDFQVFRSQAFLDMYETLPLISRYHWNFVEEVTCWYIHGYKVKEIISPKDLRDVNYSVDNLNDLDRMSKICHSIE